MPVEGNKAVIQRIVEEVYNKGNLAMADRITESNFVAHFPGMELKGLEDYKRMISGMLTAFPDLCFTIDDIFSEGDKAAVRYTMTATHKGEFMGIAPTGKNVTITGISITRFEDGKQVESWGIMDNLGMMQQLGITPPQ
jgi:predicted ester cyclase